MTMVGLGLAWEGSRFGQPLRYGRPQVNDDQCAIAVMLNLVDPPFPGRGFRHGGRDFELDEAERGY
jgi:hypothetical protein